MREKKKMKKEILEEISKKVDNCENLKKRELIKNIVGCDEWYVNMDVNVFVNILVDLGYTKDQALKYFELIILDY